MRKELNKWQFHFYFGRDYRTFERGWKQVDFAILKMTSFPMEGNRIAKENYKGFWVHFLIWFPIDF